MRASTTTSYGTEFGLRYPASGDLYLDRRNLSVWIKDSDTFYFYVKVHGDDGSDYLLRYDPLSGSPYTTGSNDEYVVIPVGTKYKDGTWRELRRDLEADFHLMYPAIDIEYIIRVYVRGDFYLDDLRFFDQKKYYYAAGQRVAMRENDEVYYFLTDHLGSTNITLDASGTKIAELRYMPWGSQRYSSGSTPTDYRYTGQRHEPELGLYYYGARWYDSYLNRWIQPDTLIPDPNNPLAYDRYAYSYNNALKYTDPSGHWPEINWNINTQQVVQNITNWALNATGLSDQGFTSSDIDTTLSTASTVLDIFAGVMDVIAVSVVGAVTVIGAPMAGPEISYPVGELVAQPILLAGNLLATEATVCTVGSELLSGDLGLDISLQSGADGFAIDGEISIGTGTTIGAATTGIGWIPGVPSWGSLGLQSIAISNDFEVGQELGLLDDTSWEFPLFYSTEQLPYDQYLPLIMREEEY